MKIAVISRYLPSESKGGVGYQVHFLANSLIELGHQVTVFSTCSRPDDALYEVCGMQAGPFSRPSMLKLFNFPCSLRNVDFGEFDIVHSHGDDYLLKKGKVPIVRTFHGSAIAEALHADHAKAAIRQLVLYPLEFVSAIRCSFSVGVSNNTKKCIPPIHTVIPNGTDTQMFMSGESDKSRHPSILFVGTIEGRKRGKLLAEHFRKYVRSEIPESELWLVSDKEVAGEGIVNYGRVSSSELASLYRQAWVFCLPSKYEGFGIPYIEALAAGTPIVATPNAGAREVLQNGRYGLLCRAKDIGSELIRLLKNRQLREELAVKGKERAIVFDKSLVLEQYVQLYERLARDRIGSQAKEVAI